MARKQRKPSAARRPADDKPRGPRLTRTGKPVTRRRRTAPELGIEAGPERSGRIPVVAIVGRPNVGKSSLFNRLAGSRIAIEDPRPGTTRDRVSALVRLYSRDGEQRVVELFDTAGIGIVDEAEVQPHVDEQIENALASADVLLFVVDTRDGVLALDQEVAQRLHNAGRPVVVIANKSDDQNLDAKSHAFFEFGLGDPVPASAKTGRAVKEIAQLVCGLLPARSEAETLDPPELYLAIVGRRNVGKSTLTNTLAGQERVIASELPGTTRDSVDVRFNVDGHTFVAIDTAGVRKQKKLEHSVEFFGQSRSFRAVRRASVVVLLMDALTPISHVDTQLLTVALEEAKPVILAVNKWDLAAAEGHKPGEYTNYLRRKLPLADFAPIVLLSAKDGTNVLALIDIARDLHEQAGQRVSTGELNRVVNSAFDRHHPQPRENRLGKLFYATQVGVYPPTVVLFVNEPDLFPDNWRTYLVRQLREHTPFTEIPVRVKYKAREKVVLERRS
ncbi:MAG: ribosome biogenesis GTPase Der [Planctomycetes bacterium]|nr:ribosome biogenesis GTPase Der [Planctomycetota bacterium]